ncbi:hypothetical protein RclHR1_00130038 [Rhizophagus clarus]|uniref:Uncharacterized protein n=1 Tax=Rhizophagus clarus TaxID=94130 RepID=A0A2Z6Q8Y0_9GLOM|nr:hypothetical protein RclHR1_00130038 [Rhizophagus clarus]GES76839.1 hypothetical protein GLOIN_2v1476099 [Rhizophagus clarus]
MAENIYTTTQENSNSPQVSSTSGYSHNKILYQHNTLSFSQNNDNNSDGKAETQILSQIYHINEQLNQFSNAFALDNYNPINERTPSPIYIVPPSTPTYSKDEGFDFQSSTLGGTSTKELQLNNTMNNINYTNVLPFMSTGTINLTWPIQNQYVNIASTVNLEENSSNSTIINNNFVGFDDDDNMTGIEAQKKQIFNNNNNNNNSGNFLVNEFQNLKLE